MLVRHWLVKTGHGETLTLPPRGYYSENKHYSVYIPVFTYCIRKYVRWQNIRELAKRNQYSRGQKFAPVL